MGRRVSGRPLEAAARSTWTDIAFVAPADAIFGAQRAARGVQCIEPRRLLKERRVATEMNAGCAACLRPEFGHTHRVRFSQYIANTTADSMRPAMMSTIASTRICGANPAYTAPVPVQGLPAKHGTRRACACSSKRGKAPNRSTSSVVDCGFPVIADRHFLVILPGPEIGERLACPASSRAIFSQQWCSAS
jgi:hypothetical protein